jgi:hypothetical protein
MLLKELAKITVTILQTRKRPRTPETGSYNRKLYTLLQNPIRLKKMEGSLAITDFLIAIRKKIASDWAYNLILFQNDKIV